MFGDGAHLGTFHSQDVNFYYRNLGENAQLRVERFHTARG
jgi:hypothetical protein